jgi:hypothetical protein
MSIKNSSDTIGNQTRGLAICSAVAQANAPLSAPNSIEPKNNLNVSSDPLQFFGAWCALRKKNFPV